ncbi:HlyD family secretion protein [Bacteroidales bacterium OttesenSCG-928-I14]|nr:HlyD family secretion protein [Bacteroidales bacterium OttesenSCG-928-I14]
MNNIELRSEEMQDILTRPPHILVRAGISVICFVILLLLIGSYFFKYPDIVPGEIVITTENPPTWIVAKTSGKIKEWNFTDKSEVRQGQRLAVIENPAATEDIYRLKTYLSQCVISDTVTFIPNEILSGNYELGTLQNSHSALVRTIINYNNFVSYNSTYKEKQAILTQIAGHNRYSEALDKQLELKNKELEIAQRAYEREKELYNKGVISRSQMDIAENTLLAMRQSIQQLETNRISSQIEAGQLNASLSKLDAQYLREENSIMTELRSTYSELIYAIESWEQAYVLSAPKDGIITFDTYWAQDQFVNTGSKVFAVVSQQPGKMIGRIKSPASMSGKIKESHRVNIKVHDYPYMEFGTLNGTVKNISLIPNESFYHIDVEFPNELKTNTGKILNFTGEMTGSAEIITDERSLLIRILSPLEYLIKEHI